MDEVGDFQTIVRDATAEDVTDEWIASLAKRLAGSGDLIRGHAGSTADIPSTGGPSSLTTLLCPLFLSAAGWLVPKLGVPGRPAGGLDVMAQISGYRTELDPVEVRSVLDQCGYAHFDALGRIAPMDRSLFAYRQSVGAQAVAPLVIASLLSKKFAVGVERVGLDIRVADHGNFGGSLTQARENARCFIRVAALLEIQAHGFITDAAQPYQPYIGRGEALLALHSYFVDDMDPWLSRHIDQCKFMAMQLIGTAIDGEAATFRRKFESHLIAQGAAWSGFEDAIDRLRGQQTTEIRTGRSGYVSFDLGQIRDGLVVAQRKNQNLSRFPDPAGVVLLVEPDELVDGDQPVMRVRSEPTSERVLLATLQDAVAISRFPRSSNVDVVNA
jgi:thymidine phosphorylase